MDYSRTLSASDHGDRQSWANHNTHKSKATSLLDASRQSAAYSERARHLNRGMMEHFGNAVVGLLACKQCFVSTLPKNGEVPSEQVRIGSALTGTVEVIDLARISSKNTPHNAVCPFLRPDDPLAPSLIGRESECGEHSILGQLMASDGTEILFAAGWRKAPFRPSEIAWLSRAIPVILSTAEIALASPPVHSELQTFLEQLIWPAFVIDEGLRLCEANGTGRKLLRDVGVLRVRNGLLVGENSEVTNGLRKVLHSAMQVQPYRRWANVTVSLSADRQQHVFAWVGALPVPHVAGQMLMIVPRVDAKAGAKRISEAFGLSFTEEKIVANFLCGLCPRLIAAELGLTEATVRTYTKRLMLKLGINRQAELFLLYILTLSPFESNRRPSWSNACAE